MIFRCKMCGGTLEITDGQSTAVCDYCGTNQTLPRLTDEKKGNLYERANHFRRNNEFDKAEAIYEQILNEDATDAEAYWSLVLCRYGIEYVETPSSTKRTPTVNRVQYTSIFEDANYRSAIEYADVRQKLIYEEEAGVINQIQKGILEISSREEPFDVFICYKETDEYGKRTPDSVLANELYHELTEEGFKVFFSRITLEDKLGTAYEPYIFAALNSAKVMVVLGTRPEYFGAVWVKNEWSRYLALVKQSGGKKVLIPAYRDMNAYDLPEEFAHLQAQDMSKLGFMQDLIRGINKLTKPQKSAPPAYTASASASADVQKILRRTDILIDSRDWENAAVYCEKALDADPENGQAYVYQLMIRLRVTDESHLGSVKSRIDILPEYKNAIRFADEDTCSRLISYSKQVNAELARIEQARKDNEAAAAASAEALRRERQRQEELNRRQAYESSYQETRATIKRLKKQRNKKILWGLILLCFFWPAGVYFLYKAHTINSDIKLLK